MVAEDHRSAIPVLYEHGRRRWDLGLRLTYHNHGFEFTRPPDGRTGMKLLLEGLDPQAIELCADLGWVHLGAQIQLPFRGPMASVSA